jgi:hypothetical protein
MIRVFGYIDVEGRLVLYERATFASMVSKMKGEVELVVKTRKRRRSGVQNAYYWGVVVPMVRDGLMEMGNDVSVEETHEFLKCNFNYTEVVNEDSGEVLRVPRSTTNLDTKEFGEFVEMVSRWASEWLGIVIPAPNEQVRMFEKE